MRKSIFFAVLLAMVVCSMGTVVSAETVTFEGFREMGFTAVNSDINSVFSLPLTPGKFDESYAVGAIPVLIGADSELAYCLQFTANLNQDPGGYGAVLNPLPATVPSYLNEVQLFAAIPQIAYIIDQNPLDPDYTGSTDATPTRIMGAAIQKAVWKLVHGENPVITVKPTSFEIIGDLTGRITEFVIETTADDLIKASQGKRLLSCETNGPVLFTIDATPVKTDTFFHIGVVVAGEQEETQPGGTTIITIPAEGQPVTIRTDIGVFIDLAEGQVLLEGGAALSAVLEGGSVSATIDLGDQFPPVTVTAEAVGRSVILVEDFNDGPQTDDWQDLIITETCEYQAVTSVNDGDGFGDPGTIGFWKHQFKVANGDSKGKAQVANLASFLPITLPDDEVNTDFQIISSFGEGVSILCLKKATMQQRAVQQYFALLLNYLTGEIETNTLVLADIDFDGEVDENVTFVEALGAFWAAWDDERYEDAKDICDSINNM